MKWYCCKYFQTKKIKDFTNKNLIYFNSRDQTKTRLEGEKEKVKIERGVSLIR